MQEEHKLTNWDEINSPIRFFGGELYSFDEGEIFLGTTMNDKLRGIGKGDTAYGGKGDDSFFLASIPNDESLFRRLDGGAGTDTIHLLGGDNGPGRFSLFTTKSGANILDLDRLFRDKMVLNVEEVHGEDADRE